jgi:hypothetical protein
MRYVALFLAFLCSLSAISAQNVTIKGKDFYLDGKPWLPKGIKVEAFARPAYIPSAPRWMNDSTNLQGRAWVVSSFFRTFDLT